MDEKPGDLLPIKELAAYLKIPKLTLHKLVWKGKIPIQKIGRHWRFRKKCRRGARAGTRHYGGRRAPLTANLWADQLLKKIGKVSSLYHCMILIVGPAASGQTTVFQEVSASHSVALVKANRELFRPMPDLTERQRAFQAPQLLGGIVGKAPGELVLLQNTEIPFDVYQKQNPLRLLLGLSQNRKAVPVK